MTQVWVFRNSDTDIHVFNRFDHIKPSIEITFSRCRDVTIEEIQRSGNLVVFEVKGNRDGQAFTDALNFQRLSVWTEPSHL